MFLVWYTMVYRGIPWYTYCDSFSVNTVNSVNGISVNSVNTVNNNTYLV